MLNAVIVRQAIQHLTFNTEITLLPHNLCPFFNFTLIFNLIHLYKFVAQKSD